MGISNFLTSTLKVVGNGLVRKRHFKNRVSEPNSGGKNGDFLTSKNFRAQNGLVRNFQFFKRSKKSALTRYTTMGYSDFYRTLKFSHEKSTFYPHFRNVKHMPLWSVSLSKNSFWGLGFSPPAADWDLGFGELAITPPQTPDTKNQTPDTPPQTPNPNSSPLHYIWFKAFFRSRDHGSYLF